MVLEEIQVFEALYKWGQKECERKGLNKDNPNDMKKILAKGIQECRFPLMDKADFVRGVVTKGVLDTQDVITLQSYFLLPKDEG